MSDELNQTLPAGVKRLRLGILNAAEDSPYGFTRLHLGLGMMSREDPRLEIVLSPHLPGLASDFERLVNTFLLRIDALLIVCPRAAAEAQILGVARELGLPTWLDWGDDVLNVHYENPVHNVFVDREVMRRCMSDMIGAATVATVTTETIRQAFPKPERLTILDGECAIRPNDRPRRKFISWRGMGSHRGDVESVLPDLEHFFADPCWGDWRIVLFGEPPPVFTVRLAKAAGEDPEAALQGGGKRIIAAPSWPTVLHFYENWARFAPFVHIVPLEDTPFNRAKNPNAWLECAGIGSAVIAPKWCPEWRQPGMIHYGPHPERIGQTDFGEVLRRELVRFAPLPAAEQDRLNGDRPEAEREVYGGMHAHVFPMRQAVFPHQTTAALNRRRWAILRKLAAARPGQQSQTLNYDYAAPLA